MIHRDYICSFIYIENYTMDSQLGKGKPLSKYETMALLDLIESSEVINTNKTTNATNNKIKNVEWKRLTDMFNATASSCRRTPQQLRLKWENLKKNARRRSKKIKMNDSQTNGVLTEYIPPDDILDRVTSLLGNTDSEFVVVFGETEGIVVCEASDGGSGCDGGTGSGDENDDDFAIRQEALPEVDTPKMKPRRRIDTDQEQVEVKKKPKPDGNESIDIKNLAIAKYYTAKTQCLDAKLQNIFLENDKFNLENEKLKLEVEKLKLEIDKLKSL